MPSMDESWEMRNGLVIPNRSVLAAMTNKQSHADGTLSDEEMRFLLRRAEGGFGLITTAASHVQESGQGWEGEFGVWGDHHLPGLTSLATQLKQHDSKSFVQIFHGGMRAPSSITGQQASSASVNFISESEGSSRRLSKVEVEETISCFIKAAQRCEAAGFDGVELHGAHGYLIAQFLGSNTNRRSDAFGGDVEQRCTFLLRIIRGIREVVSDDLPSWSVFHQFLKIGITMEDTKQVIELLIKERIDALHISCWDVFEKQDNNQTITRNFVPSIRFHSDCIDWFGLECSGCSVCPRSRGSSCRRCSSRTAASRLGFLGHRFDLQSEDSSHSRLKNFVRRPESNIR